MNAVTRRFSLLLLLICMLFLVACANDVTTAVVSPPADNASASISASALPSASASSEATAPETALPTAADTVSENVAALFNQYGWSVGNKLSETEAEMPDSLLTNVEDSPMQFYWMQAAVLSSEISFDLNAFFGKQLVIDVYEISGDLPEKYTHPSMKNTRGIVYRNEEGCIAGAHIDTGRHTGISYSLARHDVEDITGMPLLSYWAWNYYDLADPVNVAADNRTAEEVIMRYFEGVASGDHTKLLSTLCLSMKLESLFSNMDNSIPYLESPAYYNYLVGVQVLSIEKYPSVERAGFTMYAVTIDAKLSEEAKRILDNDGIMTRFVIVAAENGSLRIFGDGTGP